MTTRRLFLTGLASIIAAPAIVRASSLMPVKAYPNPAWSNLIGAETDLTPASLDRMSAALWPGIRNWWGVHSYGEWREVFGAADT